MVPCMECKYCTGKRQIFFHKLFLSNIGFYLLFMFTWVRLLHTVTVDADLTGVHTAVWLTVRLVHSLYHSFSLGYSVSTWWQKEMHFRVQNASFACTCSFLFGLADAIKPLLLVEGIIGLEWVSLALRSIFEADSKEVFDWKKQYIPKHWMLWLNRFYNQRVYLNNRICKIFKLRFFPADIMSDQREESSYLLGLWGKNIELHKHF